MIIPSDDKPRENEISVWTVATGNIKIHKKRSKKAVEFILGLDGFVGVHPVQDKGTLWLFDSKNKAIIAREQMDDKGIVTGDNICEVFINKKYVGDVE